MRKNNYNDILIWSAALVTVIRYSAAFIASDMPMITGALSVIITIALGLSGLGMGVLDVIGGAVLFQGWRRNMPKNGQAWLFRFKVLTGFVFGLIVNGIVIIVPFTVSRVLQSTMDHVLGVGLGLWVWACAVNIAPYMLIGGVSVSSNLGITEGENTEKMPKNTGNLPEKSLDWRRVDPAEYAFIAGASTAELMKVYGIEDRTARNWRKHAQEAK